MKKVIFLVSIIIQSLLLLPLITSQIPVLEQGFLLAALILEAISLVVITWQYSQVSSKKAFISGFAFTTIVAVIFAIPFVTGFWTRVDGADLIVVAYFLGGFISSAILSEICEFIRQRQLKNLAV